MAAPRPVTPVNEEFFKSPPALGLVDFSWDNFYLPKDGQTPLGPVVPLVDFVTRHFGRDALESAFLCDPGTDDFLAGILAFDEKSRLLPRIIVPSFGNIRGEMTYQNTLTLVALSGAMGVTVAKGAQRPMSGPMPEDASGEHGIDGLGGASPWNMEQLEEKKRLIQTHEDGVRLLKEDIAARYHEQRPAITILNTGSMTDLAYLLQQLEAEHPEALGKIRGISLMGGGIDTNQWHTNVSDYAEFNIFQDPEAASIAFAVIERRRIPALVFPLDLTHQTGVRENHEGAWLKDEARRTDNPVADMAAQLYKAGGFDITRSQEIFGFSGENITRFMHDANTVTGLDRPDLYAGFHATVRIETQGEKAGQTVVTSNADGAIFVVVRADAARVVGDWQEKISTYTLDPALAR